MNKRFEFHENLNHNGPYIVDREKGTGYAADPSPGSTPASQALCDLLNELHERAEKVKAILVADMTSDAQMTTPLGLLPINSEGMRKVVDALVTANAEVHEMQKQLDAVQPQPTLLPFDLESPHICATRCDWPRCTLPGCIDKADEIEPTPTKGGGDE